MNTEPRGLWLWRKTSAEVAEDDEEEAEAEEELAAVALTAYSWTPRRRLSQSGCHTPGSSHFPKNERDGERDHHEACYQVKVRYGTIIDPPNHRRCTPFLTSGQRVADRPRSCALGDSIPLMRRLEALVGGASCRSPAGCLQRLLDDGGTSCHSRAISGSSESGSASVVHTRSVPSPRQTPRTSRDVT